MESYHPEDPGFGVACTFTHRMRHHQPETSFCAMNFSPGQTDRLILTTTRVLPLKSKPPYRMVQEVVNVGLPPQASEDEGETDESVEAEESEEEETSEADSPDIPCNALYFLTPAVLFCLAASFV